MVSLVSLLCSGQVVEEPADISEPGGGNGLLMNPPEGPGGPGGLDGDPPAEQLPPSRSPSRLALCADGTVLVSLEDAEGRDLRGRETVLFLVLESEEVPLVRQLIEDAQQDIASRILGRLPRRR